jgi:flagellar motor component MotA
MTQNEFLKEYYAVAGRALAFSEKARREGILALEEDLDHGKIDNRDIFEYGIRFVLDGIECVFIDKILSNLVKQEENENMHILKTIQKEAVLMIQAGLNPKLLYALLNSYTNLALIEDELNDKYGLF